MSNLNSQPHAFTRRPRPTQPLRFALIGTAALVAAIAVPATAGIITDTPDGFAVRSQGSVSVGGNSTIFGSLGAAGSSSLGWGATVTGTLESGSPHSWTTPTLGPIPGAGSQAINLGYQQSISLGAGAYGAFTSGTQTQLNLSAGDYVFSNFQLGYSGRVLADTSAGDVYLYVGNALSAGDQTRFEKTGAGSLFIVTGGSASFGYQSQLSSSIYSLGSQSFANETKLTGLAWAGGSTSIGYGSTFNFSSPVPAPGAIAALALAGFLGARRRKA